MLSLLIGLLFLFPIGFGKELPKPSAHAWSVKNGLILDARGREVGVYGFDSISNSTKRRILLFLKEHSN